MKRTQKSVQITVGSFLVAVVFISVAAAQNATQIAKTAFGSTVLLVMEDSNSQPIGLGSGFFVKPRQIATNLHVVEGAASGYAKLIGEKTKYDIRGISAIDEKRDLVILNVTAFGKQPLPLHDSDTVLVGETVYAVGNPHGLEGTFSQGIISSVRTVGTDKLLQLTAPISPGSSGGPVLNHRGNVIGVSVATYRGGQNLNFAIPSNYLAKLVLQIRTATPLSQTGQAKSKRSLLSNYGGRSTAAVTGSAFRWHGSYNNYSDYSFSLRNRLREDIRKVYCLVVFYDAEENPIEADVVQFQDIIPAGLAKRVTDCKVHSSVKQLTTEYEGIIGYKDAPHTKLEFRVIDFEIVE